MVCFGLTCGCPPYQLNWFIVILHESPKLSTIRLTCGFSVDLLMLFLYLSPIVVPRRWLQLRESGIQFLSEQRLLSEVLARALLLIAKSWLPWRHVHWRKVGKSQLTSLFKDGRRLSTKSCGISMITALRYAVPIAFSSQCQSVWKQKTLRLGLLCQLNLHWGLLFLRVVGRRGRGSCSSHSFLGLECKRNWAFFLWSW